MGSPTSLRSSGDRETPSFTPGPWKFEHNGVDDTWIASDAPVLGDIVCQPPDKEYNDSRENWTANAHLIVAAPDLYAAAQLLEDAETFNANCQECEGVCVPELCGECFPLFDKARVARRIALAKARGEQP